MRYLVQVWIDPIEVEAENIEDAENKAVEEVNNFFDRYITDCAEAQKIFDNGKWRYINFDERRAGND